MNKPKQSLQRSLEILRENGLDPELEVCLMGIRGYYTGEGNKRGIYDDAIFLCGPEAYLAFNGNTDPSITRKGVAVIKAGLWTYKIGIHGLSKPVSKRYKALVQAAPVTVARDGVGDDTGYFGINIHCGGHNSTSSLGCQTIFPDQWPSFIAAVRDQMARAKQEKIKYLLVDNF